VLQESLVEACHLGRGYEVKGQIKTALPPGFLEQRPHDLPQEAQVHTAKALAIPQR
jgi:hypothetical protein